VQHWNLMEVDAPNGIRDPAVLHEDDGARAVLIALSPGQSLGDHQVKENAWLTVLDGAVRISCAGEDVDAGPGALFHFAPDERHAIASEGGARILLLLAPWPGEGHFRGNA